MSDIENGQEIGKNGKPTGGFNRNRLAPFQKESTPEERRDTAALLIREYARTTINLTGQGHGAYMLRKRQIRAIKALADLL